MFIQFLKCFIVLLFFFAFNIASSQSNDFQVSSVAAESHPEVSAVLTVRNPDKIETDKILFFDGDDQLKVKFSEPRRAKKIAKNKSVLFVVLNHQAHRNRTSWYQNVLKDAINRGMMNTGDEFSLVSFDCNRPEYDKSGSNKKQLLFPESPSFVGNPDEFEVLVSSIDKRKDRFIDNCRVKGDIYGAIIESLKIMGDHNTSKSKSIVVLADDLSVPELNVDITGMARDMNIPIYGITYYQNIKRDYGIEEICENTYGEYAIDYPSNNVSKMSEVLLNFMDNQIERASGWEYDVKFNVKRPKDGKSHAVRVQYKNERAVTGFQYISPSMSPIEWIAANPIMFIIYLLILLLLGVIVRYYIMKRKKEIEKREASQNQQLEKMKVMQDEAEKKASSQHQELKKLRDKEKKAEEQKRKEIEKEELERVLREMKMRGNLPWFTFNDSGLDSNVEMNQPVFSFGRSKEVNCQLQNKTVSRKHFSVKYIDGRYELHDEGSSNGTFLNGKRIKGSSPIEHGGIIGAGELLITFHI